MSDRRLPHRNLRMIVDVTKQTATAGALRRDSARLNRRLTPSSTDFRQVPEAELTIHANGMKKDLQEAARRIIDRSSPGDPLIAPAESSQESVLDSPQTPVAPEIVSASFAETTAVPELDDESLQDVIDRELGQSSDQQLLWEQDEDYNPPFPLVRSTNSQDLEAKTEVQAGQSLAPIDSDKPKGELLDMPRVDHE